METPMLPYFKISKITRAQERRKEQELRAIIKTLARHKLKSPNDSKRSERSFKRLVPFDAIIVKSQPPAVLLTAQDWFSDLAVNLDDKQKWKMAENLNTDPYFDGFTMYGADHNDYFRHSFHVREPTESTNHGHLYAWTHYSVLDLPDEDDSYSFLSESCTYMGFSKVTLKNLKEAWVCCFNDLNYVLNKLVDGGRLVSYHYDKDVFFIDKKDIFLQENLKYDKKFLVNEIFTAIANFNIENGNIWDLSNVDGPYIDAELVTPNSTTEYLLNQIAVDLIPITNGNWSDSFFQPNTLAKIFSVGDIDITEYGLKRSTIAMLYKLQDLGYLKLVKDGDL